MHKLIFIIAAILVGTSCYALKPSKKYEAIPDTMNIAYEKNTISSPGNVKLASWTLLPTKELDNKTTIVLAYADAGNMSWWLTYGTSMAKAGFTVVMFDYRGFGESDDFAIDRNMLYYNEFVTDLRTVFAFAAARYPTHKTGIAAFSMGTIIATLAAKDMHPAFIIGEGYVTDPIAVKAYYAGKKDVILLPADAAGYSKTLLDLKTQTLIFSGKKDEVTTDEAVQNLEQSRSNVTVITFEGGHMQGFWILSRGIGGSPYLNAIRQFLKLG